MDTNRLQPEPVLAEAAQWHARLHADVRAATALRPAFEQWLALDVRHRLAYADVCAVDYAAQQSDTEAERDFVPVVGRGRPLRTWVAGATLSLVVLFFAWQGARPWDRLRADLHTTESEVREFALDDGSRAWLAGDSALALQYAPDGRGLHLLRGEAFFEVQRDPSRPFAVRAGAVTVTAVGTRYSVSHRRAGAILVEVEEGKVAVALADGRTQPVAAGEQLRIDADGIGNELLPLASRASTWRDGLLVFDETPAADAVAQLDAYIPGRVVLTADARTTRISAAIAVTDAKSALLAIAEREGWRADGIPGVVLVLH